MPTVETESLTAFFGLGGNLVLGFKIIQKKIVWKKIVVSFTHLLGRRLSWKFVELVARE